MASSRDQILKKVRKATAQAVPIPFPDEGNYTDYFVKTGMENEIEFAQNFVSLQGRVCFFVKIFLFKKHGQNLKKKRGWVKKIFCVPKKN